MGSYKFKRRAGQSENIPLLPGIFPLCSGQFMRPQLCLVHCTEGSAVNDGFLMTLFTEPLNLHHLFAIAEKTTVYLYTNKVLFKSIINIRKLICVF